MLRPSCEKDVLIALSEAVQMLSIPQFVRARKQDRRSLQRGASQRGCAP
jgi:hypothetical protein